MNDSLLALIIAISFTALLIIVELLKRKLNISSEITRRIAHISTGVVSIAAYSLLPLWLYIAAIVAVGSLIVYSQRTSLFKSIHNVRRKTYGELFLPAGLLATIPISLLEPNVYIPSILLVTFADSLAGITSDLTRKHKKTLLGSVVFFIVASGILIMATQHPLYMAIGISLLVTIVERVSGLGSDNLTIPVSTALLLVLL